MSSLYQNLLNRCSQENSPAPKRATKVQRIRRSSITVTTCTKYIGRLTQDRKKKQRKSVRFSSNVLMQQAITEGDVQEVKQLIEKFGSRVVNEPEPSGLSPSMRCVFEGQMAPLRLLIEAGADLTAQDGERCTVLHVAASMDDVDATKLILNRCKHCLTQVRTVDGERPIDLAESTEVARLLFQADLKMSRGADRECAITALVREHCYKNGSCEALNDALRRSTDYDSLLHMAAGKNYPRLASYLKMEARDSRGWTALHTAAYFNNIDMVLLLTQQGASIHSLTNSYKKASDPNSYTHYFEKNICKLLFTLCFFVHVKVCVCVCCNFVCICFITGSLKCFKLKSKAVMA